MKIAALIFFSLTSFSLFAFETVSLTEKLPEMALTETKFIVEGRLWENATKVCQDKGLDYAVQAEKGFTYEVLVNRLGKGMLLGGFARFNCMKEKRP